MGTRALFLLAITTFLIGSFVNKVSAIHCWRCSSDASIAALYCNDPFDSSNITEQQKRWSYVECMYPPSQLNPHSQQLAQRAVCKKIKQLVNDNVIISRSCYWEDVNAQKNDCMNATTPSYIRTIFCETCSTDGCNGEAMNPVAKTGNSFDGGINAIDEQKNVVDDKNATTCNCKKSSASTLNVKTIANVVNLLVAFIFAQYFILGCRNMLKQANS
ncbi:uncharacterized protein LOC129568177 [Sitodiplosis mosellana]|uniref:uncharacterized protein LOC129568177 n=1 Tax=Sitodiplosis mosellana TaxID=263140 RepID=UPI0024453103|nr:uncharacterized protein LOC129568177 [Sitodiplosis mosellana]